MLKSQFDFLCKSYGDSSLQDSEKWKAIRYIYNENPLTDVQYLLKNNRVIYLDNSDIGPGFYISEVPYTFSMPKSDEQVITFIPLSKIDKITFITDYVDQKSKVSNSSVKVDYNSPLYEAVSNNEDNGYSSVIE